MASYGPAIVGGLFDYFSAKEANKANLDANAGAQDSSAADRALLQASGNTTDPFSKQTFDASGVNKSFTGPGAGNALETQALQTGGDIGRAQTQNDLSSNFQLSVPSLTDARGIIEEGNALQQGTIDKGLSDIASLNQRQFGGLNNTGANAATIDAMARFANENQRGSPQDAIGLYQKSASNDSAILQALLNANRPQGPSAPGFTSANANAAGSLLAQSPTPAPIADLSGVIGPAAGGSVVQQMIAQEQAATQNKMFLDALRQLGNTGSGSIN